MWRSRARAAPDNPARTPRRTPATRRTPPAMRTAGRNGSCAWPRSLRLQPGFVDDAAGVDAGLDQETGGLFRRVQDRFERAVDELLLAEARLVADAGNVLADLIDDRPGRTGSRNQREIDAREIAAIAELGQGRNVREQRRALRPVDRQAVHGAGRQVGDEVLHAE